jgi:hypothetical protein
LDGSVVSRKPFLTHRWHNNALVRGCAKQLGDVPRCNLSGFPKQRQRPSLPGVQVSHQLRLILAASFSLAERLRAYFVEGNRHPADEVVDPVW